jgi:hypothetical protein
LGQTLIAPENVTLPVSLAGRRAVRERVGYLAEQLGIADTLEYSHRGVIRCRRFSYACRRKYYASRALSFGATLPGIRRTLVRAG